VPAAQVLALKRTNRLPGDPTLGQDDSFAGQG